MWLDNFRPKDANLLLTVASIVLLGLVGLYALQIFSPLRLNTDAIRLLRMASSAALTGEYLVEGRFEQFPHLYPFIISLLIENNAANSFTVLFLNFGFLLIGCYCMWKISSRYTTPLHSVLVLVMTLSSWIMIKHFTLPVTELVYFAVSLTTLLLLQIFFDSRGNRKYVWLALGIAATVLSISTRTVGLAFLPTIIVLAIFHRDHETLWRRIVEPIRERYTLLILIAVMVGIAIYGVLQTDWFYIQFLKKGSYFQNLLNNMEKKGLLTLLHENLVYRIRELAGVYTNIPSSKINLPLVFVMLVGVASWLFVVYCCIRLAKKGLVIVAYFVSNAALLFVWPYYATRFWLPMLPIVFALSFAAVDVDRRLFAIRRYLLFYVVLFLGIGLVALGYSTNISLASKVRFAEIYGDGSLRMTYRYAYYSPLPIEIDKVSRKSLDILIEFKETDRKPSDRDQ